jgi:uncharacterized protein
MRTLLIFIALALIVMIVKRLWQSRRPPAQRGQKSGQMVQCANCGMYIPRDEALSRGERYYCSQAHLDESGKGAP